MYMCVTSILGILPIIVCKICVGPQKFTSTVHNIFTYMYMYSIHVSVKELLLVGTLPCRGVLGNLSCGDAADGLCYTASYAVQPDDSVTFTVSARTPGNTWVGLGVSDDQFMVSAAV